LITIVIVSMQASFEITEKAGVTLLDSAVTAADFYRSGGEPSSDSVIEEALAYPRNPQPRWGLSLEAAAVDG
jgi:hypothetical protein